MSTISFRKSSLFRFIAFTVLASFAGMLPAQPGYAQVAIVMPPVGQMIHVTRHFEPPQMVGLKINLKDPFSFGFIMDQGENPMSDSVKKEEFNKIVKYFLVSLAMPNKDMWVNLSPFESKRIIPEVFAQTEMGRDLLAQDYVLKQFTASLMYPESGLGKEFWSKVYGEAQARFGTTDINVNTFNKVWIVADHADVYQKGDTAFLVGSHLKVMLEQDFKAIEQNKEQFGDVGAVANDSDDAKTQMASQVVREIIIPAIEKEVNEGQSFAAVRQIYNAEIMATWFKKTLRESLLGQVFADKSKIAGQRVSDPQAKEKIFQQYLRAYKRGVFNYIKREMTPDGQTIPRRYLSGGAQFVDKRVVSEYTPEEIERDVQAANLQAGELAERLSQIQKNQGMEAVQREIQKQVPESNNYTPRSMVGILPRIQLRPESRAIASRTLADQITPIGATDAVRVEIRDLVSKLATPQQVEGDQSQAVLDLLKQQQRDRLAVLAPSFDNAMTAPTVGALLNTITESPMTLVDKSRVVAGVLTPTVPAVEAVRNFGEKEVIRPLDLALASFTPAEHQLPATVEQQTPTFDLTQALLANYQANPQETAGILAELGNSTTPTNQDISDIEEKIRALADKREEAQAFVMGQLSQAQGRDLVMSLMDIKGNLAQQVNKRIGSNNELGRYLQLPPETRQNESAIRDYVNNNQEIKDKAQITANLMDIRDTLDQAMQVATSRIKAALPTTMRNPIEKFVEPLASGMLNGIQIDLENRVAQRATTVEPEKVETLGTLLSNALPSVSDRFGNATSEKPEILRLYHDNEPMLRGGARESKPITDLFTKNGITAQNDIQAAQDAIEKIRAMQQEEEQNMAKLLRPAVSENMAEQLAPMVVREVMRQVANPESGKMNELGTLLSNALPSISDRFGNATSEKPEILQLYHQNESTLRVAPPEQVTNFLSQKGIAQNDIQAAQDAIEKIRAMQQEEEQNMAKLLRPAVSENMAEQLAPMVVREVMRQVADRTLGGINLSNEHLTLNIKVDGKGMPLPPQYQDPALMNINGLVSVIRSITPLTPQNVPALYELTK